LIKTEDDFRKEMRLCPRGGKGVLTIKHMLESEEYFAKGRMFAKAILEPGSSLGLHVHKNEMEFIYILSGVATVVDNGEKEILHRGDVLYTGDGDSHSIANNNNTDLEYIAIILRNGESNDG